MTEMVNGEVQSNSNFAPTPVTPSQATAPTQTPSEERTFKQSEVNDLVGRARHEAIERYKRDTSMASHTTYTQPVQQPQGYGQQQAQQGMYAAPQQPQYNGMSEPEYRRIAAEEARRSRNEWQQEAQRQAEEQHAQRIASEFFTKVGSGDGGLPGFEKIMSESGIDLRSIPYHVQLANNVDNTREVMVELIRNPAKIGMLQNLIDIDVKNGRQPNLAMAEMKRISSALKENANAAKYTSPNEPLSQMRPSNAGTGNHGALTVSDYKRKYKV